MNLSDILGLNDSFFISYDKTEGTQGLYMQGELPVNRFGTFADMSCYYGEPKTISGSFAILNIHGTSEQYRSGLRQILINEKERRIGLSDQCRSSAARLERMWL
jgi:hemolysin activation/secretion protein